VAGVLISSALHLPRTYPRPRRTGTGLGRHCTREATLGFLAAEQAPGAVQAMDSRNNLYIVENRGRKIHEFTQKPNS